MFRMNVTTNFKFKSFEKGSAYKNDSIPAEVFERWSKRKLIRVIKDESVEDIKSKKGKSKKDDNATIKSDVPSTSKLSDNG